MYTGWLVYKLNMIVCYIMMNKLYTGINVRIFKLWPLEGDGRRCGRKEKMISKKVLIWLLFKKMVGIYRRCSKFLQFSQMHALQYGFTDLFYMVMSTTDTCRRFDDPGDEIHVESYGHLTWDVSYCMDLMCLQRKKYKGSRLRDLGGQSTALALTIQRLGCAQSNYSGRM